MLIAQLQHIEMEIHWAEHKGDGLLKFWYAGSRKESEQSDDV